MEPAERLLKSAGDGGRPASQPRETQWSDVPLDEQPKDVANNKDDNTCSSDSSSDSSSTSGTSSSELSSGSHSESDTDKHSSDDGKNAHRRKHVASRRGKRSHKGKGAASRETLKRNSSRQEDSSISKKVLQRIKKVSSASSGSSSDGDSSDTEKSSSSSNNSTSDEDSDYNEKNKLASRRGANRDGRKHSSLVKVDAPRHSPRGEATKYYKVDEHGDYYKFKGKEGEESAYRDEDYVVGRTEREKRDSHGRRDDQGRRNSRSVEHYRDHKSKSDKYESRRKIYPSEQRQSRESSEDLIRGGHSNDRRHRNYREHRDSVHEHQKNRNTIGDSNHRKHDHRSPAKRTEDSADLRYHEGRNDSRKSDVRSRWDQSDGIRNRDHEKVETMPYSRVREKRDIDSDDGQSAEEDRNKKNRVQKRRHKERVQEEWQRNKEDTPLEKCYDKHAKQKFQLQNSDESDASSSDAPAKKEKTYSPGRRPKSRDEHSRNQRRQSSANTGGEKTGPRDHHSRDKHEERYSYSLSRREKFSDSKRSERKDRDYEKMREKSMNAEGRNRRSSFHSDKRGRYASEEETRRDGHRGGGDRKQHEERLTRVLHREKRRERRQSAESDFDKRNKVDVSDSSSAEEPVKQLATRELLRKKKKASKEDGHQGRKHLHGGQTDDEESEGNAAKRSKSEAGLDKTKKNKKKKKHKEISSSGGNSESSDEQHKKHSRRKLKKSKDQDGNHHQAPRKKEQEDSHAKHRNRVWEKKEVYDTDPETDAGEQMEWKSSTDPKQTLKRRRATSGEPQSSKRSRGHIDADKSCGEVQGSQESMRESRQEEGSKLVPKEKEVIQDLLTMRTGGAYIPPARLRLMQAQITDKSSIEYQRIAWEALKKSINGLVNKVNVSNIGVIVRELFKENIVRGRGLLARSILQAQAASPTFAHVYAAFVAVINTKFPQTGELILRRLIIQFRRGFRRNDKQACISSTRFIAHLINQQVAHEVVALEILTLLLETPTDDSIEVAIGFLKECGMKLVEVSPKGIHAIFERLRSVLHEGQLDKRTQYMIEVMFAIRKDGFKDHPAVIPELDLIEEADQFTHLITLEDATNAEDMLNVFKYDAEYEANEEKYKSIKKEIIGDSDEDGSGGSGSESDDEDGDNEDEEGEDGQQIIDKTETNLVSLRRTIYLTIQSSLDFEECAHKLLKLELKPGQVVELCHMILDCCAQQRTYEKFFGLLAQRFCQLNKMYVEPFEEIFKNAYDTIHRFETNKLRNVAKFFAHLLFTDAISWMVLSHIHLNEDETTSSSRIFIKILFQELCEYMGLPKLNERVKDPTLQEAFDGLFSRDNPRNTRFAINFFTSIGLGGLTDELREHLRSMPKPVAQVAPIINVEEESSGSRKDRNKLSSSSSSSSSGSSSSDSNSSNSSDGSSSSGSNSSSDSDSSDTESSSSSDSSSSDSSTGTSSSSSSVSSGPKRRLRQKLRKHK